MIHTIIQINFNSTSTKNKTLGIHGRETTTKKHEITKCKVNGTFVFLCFSFTHKYTHTHTHTHIHTHLNFKYSYHIKRGKWVFKVETKKKVSFEMNSLCGGNRALKTFIYFLKRSIKCDLSLHGLKLNRDVSLCEKNVKKQGINNPMPLSSLNTNFHVNMATSHDTNTHSNQINKRRFSNSNRNIIKNFCALCDFSIASTLMARRMATATQNKFYKFHNFNAFKFFNNNNNNNKNNEKSHLEFHLLFYL